MTSTKTVSLDFGVPDVVATITFDVEPPRELVGCPMCAEAAVSELAHMTMCSQCGDDASDCAACTPPAVESVYAAIIHDGPDCDAQPPAPMQRRHPWTYCFTCNDVAEDKCFHHDDNTEN